MEPLIRYSPSVDCPQTFDSLRTAIALEQRSVTVYGSTHPQPRLTKWYGPVPYAYSRLTWEPCPMPPEVEQLRQLVEALTGGQFNSVLCNFYRGGQDTVSWHSDDETFLGPNPEIASLSFGASRRFQLRHKVTGERLEYLLADRDLLYMGRGVQATWQHRIPREGRVVGSRLNLTFRNAIGV
jgi:alkylated DNA repair dioxygenase AlkB